MKRMLLIASLSAPVLAANAIEVTLASPITFSVVVDKLDLVEENDGTEVGTDRTLTSRYRFSKPISVETNGVTIVGIVRFDAEVAQPTAAIATAEGSGKTYDALTRAKQAQIARSEAMRRLRPAIVSAKERVERVSQ